MVSWTASARSFPCKSRSLNEVGLECGNLPPRRSADLEVGSLPPSNAANLKVSASTGGAVVLVEGKRPQVEEFDGNCATSAYVKMPLSP